MSDKNSYYDAGGAKFDAGKPQWDLLEYRVLEDVVKVLTFGAQKYGVNNWVDVPNARRRYFAATMRHLAAWKQSEIMDPESGLPHLAHAICSLMFLASRKLKDGKESQESSERRDPENEESSLERLPLSSGTKKEVEQRYFEGRHKP